MTTCARCGSEVGDAAACAQCGQKVLSPQSGEDTSVPDWRTETAERPAVRTPVEPAPATSAPGPPRFPLYADEAEESVSAHVETAPEPAPPSYVGEEPDEDDERGAP